MSETATPVTLTDFHAASSNKKVVVTWQTESEVENLGFILERRENFNEDWIAIASYLQNVELAGQGSSNSTQEYTFIDSLVMTNERYEYRLSEVDFSGKVSELTSTSVLYIDMERSDETLLKGFAYPNPFNPQLTVEYSLERDAKVTVKVFDVRGHEVNRLQETQQKSIGQYSLIWNAADLPSGIYLVQVRAKYDNLQSESQVMKLILNK
jgi:hypothetical protein